MSSGRWSPRLVAGVISRSIGRASRLGPLLGAGALLIGVSGCTDGEVDRLAAAYCDYMRNAEQMSLAEQQEAITALDERYLETGIQEGTLRVAIQRRCPRVIAEHDVRLMGVLGDTLGEMREDLQELR